MSNGKITLTRRQKIKLKSWMNLIVLIVVAACIIGIICLVAGRARANKRIEQEKLEAAQTAQTEARAQAEAEAAAIEAANRPPELDLTAWNLRLVDDADPLPADFAPELVDIERGEQFDARAGAYLTALIAAARSSGYDVYLCSAYRSYETQYQIYWNHVYGYQQEGMTQAEAEAATRLSVNYPGVSEHQLGLAADILESSDQDMEPWIGGSGLMLWLEEHCVEYGFIVRYPDGKTDVTGVEYEPWHLRYVGQEAAEYITEHDLCLEEFLALYE